MKVALPLLQEGDVILIRKGMEVYTEIPQVLVYPLDEQDDPWKLVQEFVKVERHLSFLVGRYIVVKTTMDGGSNQSLDYYPDGHHVHCVKVDNANIKISFYQTGCFNGIIKDIKPIGKAKLTWTIKERE